METVPVLVITYRQTIECFLAPRQRGMAPTQPPRGNGDGIDGVSAHNAAPAAVRVRSSGGPGHAAPDAVGTRYRGCTRERREYRHTPANRLRSHAAHAAAGRPADAAAAAGGSQVTMAEIPLTRPSARRW